jgi:hypothetical protein
MMDWDIEGCSWGLEVEVSRRPVGCCEKRERLFGGGNATDLRLGR